jgi:hypothetical protein
VEPPKEAQLLRSILADADVPWAALYARGGGDRIVTVADLVAAVGGRWDDCELDSLVSELGGRREKIVDPWSWPHRALARLRGRETRTSDVYVFPKEVARSR